MVTTINNSELTSTNIKSLYPNISQIKENLTNALFESGLSNVSITDLNPSGFPNDVSWTDAYKMVSERLEDNNPSTPGTLQISSEKLSRTLAATITLEKLGINFSKDFKNTSVLGALDKTLKTTSNGVLASILAKSGIFDLSDFLNETSSFEAFKLIEDTENPGNISKDNLKEYQDAFNALKSLGITTLKNFPVGSNAIQAKDILEQKTDQMLNMIGVKKNIFKKSDISSLEAISILTNLPNTMNEIKELPNGLSFNSLGNTAVASKKIITSGFDNIEEFSDMKVFNNKNPTPQLVYYEIIKSPREDDFPFPKKENTERFFEKTNETLKIRSYGTPNKVSSSILVKSPNDRLIALNVPPSKIVASADVLAANRLFWGN